MLTLKLHLIRYPLSYVTFKAKNSNVFDKSWEPAVSVTVTLSASTAEATVSIDCGHFPGLLSFALDTSRQQVR